MPCVERPDDFEQRRVRLRGMTDAELHSYFWDLVDKLVAPLIEEARTHTSPSIERSVLLRMGFSSLEAGALVTGMHERGLLGHGAGRLVLELAQAQGLSIRAAGTALLAGQHWEVLPFGSISPQEFLAGLDAFVYFHHPDLTEAFGRTILEAIAAGVPAVVPTHFEPLFGEACLYATPDTAIATVSELVADPDARQQHVQRARDIAERRFGHDAHVSRLAALIGSPTNDPGGSSLPPQLELAPPGHGHSVATIMIAGLGIEREEIEGLLRSLDRQRRHVPGFVPILVVTITRPPLADELGIETRSITSRRKWGDPAESWEVYAQRRLRQLASHYRVDNITVADPGHPDAWIALQMRPPSAG